MTDYKAIEKAAKIVERIKAIDGAIIQIDRMAIQITSNQLEDISLCIKGIETKEAPEEEKKPILDGDGSLINQNQISFTPRTMGVTWYIENGAFQVAPANSNSNKKEYKIEQPLKERLTLKLLSLLLVEKQEERELLINELSKISIHA
jgi:hypothetical protein